MIQMLGQVTNLIMPKFIARKPKIKHGTYNKYGFAITLHQYCICPRCNHILNAGPDYQPDYCSKCGQHVNLFRCSMGRGSPAWICQKGGTL